MIFLTKPTDSVIKAFIREQSQKNLTYPQMKDAQVPTGYVIDHNRIQLGFGDGVFLRAKRAIQEWTMFNLSWVELYNPP